MSIFDIYFVSPLVHGMGHFSTPAQAPAKRLFLIVGDGLRADKCFDNITHPSTGESGYLAPYIRSKVLNEATFGISHTRMPTESRPGHVAIIAGFYEDVSAVTKGWKENPVDFDSVFNQSRHTFSYGSPDILPMFADGASDKERVDAIMYGHEFEDFTKSSIELDQFVFDHIDDLFSRARRDPELNAKLKQDKTVFFLHLLGIDTAGHGYRPYSAEYYDNIKYIDRKIQEMEQMVEEFYDHDGKTSWIFTADHGMSDFGSHGDGHPDNTRTPLVAWGAGIPKPVTNAKGYHDDYSEPWQLNSVKRNDVNQADIASLMSYLVGLNYPANSVGELPLDYVDASKETKARALSANAYAIVEQYLVKEAQTAASQLRYVPFPSLSGEEHSIETRKAAIEDLISAGDYERAMKSSEELMILGLKGLRYLQTYNWLFLRTLVTCGFLGWIGYAYASFLHLFVVDVPEKSAQKVFIRLGSSGALASLTWLLWYQQSPANYYSYAFFPVFFWNQIFEHWGTITSGSRMLVAELPPKSQLSSATTMVLFGLMLLEAIVYGYFHREIFSLCFGIATMWPWIQNAKVAYQNIKLSLTWAALCCVMATFTVIPVLKVESLVQIVSAGVIMVFAGFYYTFVLCKVLHLRKTSLMIVGVQIGLIALSVVITYFTVLSLQARQGLPLGNQLIGWAVLIGSVVVPFFHLLRPVSDYRFRLLVIFLAFAPTFVILTISNEGWFYVTFFAALLTWLEFEYLFYADVKETKVVSGKRRLSLSEFRLSFFFFFMTQIGFFGIGNIASISSFSLDSVYRLIPIFDPFSMGALLIFKILVPFAVLSVCLGILNMRLGVPKSALFSMVLSVSDILSLNFFYLVVDEGSWLDIGTGISHFSISSGLCVFMILLEYLSGVLVAGVQVPQVHPSKKNN
ncbi:GPI ethanolamine phosphate transferase 1 [Trichomonascus vanleenenianus]|uniref:mannose-ethanolamine phosphotransferase MCD4 n=1 Tax=Trichomonascus vanleenenianus TaxID=2268995 RepID=UPI003ECAAC49